MTNEELLEQLLEEVKKLRRDVGILRKTIDSQSETIEELRTYINNNSDNEIINNAREAEIKETVNESVYGNVQANPNEPKSIVLSNQPKFDDKMIYGTDEDNTCPDAPEEAPRQILRKQTASCMVPRLKDPGLQCKSISRIFRQDPRTPF